MTTSRIVHRLAVAVVATDANASEVGAATGTFTFTRTGSTAATALATITPNNDGLVEGPETVRPARRQLAPAVRQGFLAAG